MAKNEIKIILSAEDSQFKRTVESAGKELKKMAKDGSLGMVAMGAAFVTVGKAMQDTLDTMDQISKMSSKTGFSTESLSALKYAAELSDVSLESLEKSFIKLSKSVDGNSPSFSKLNINLKDSNGTLKSNETILMEVADAFAGMEDGAQKTAIATEIFGKSGADMIPLLNSGSEAIRAQMQEAENLGITFDSVSAKQAERFNDSITTLTNSAKGFTQELVLALMPTIDTLSGKFETVSGKATKTGNNLTPLKAIARGIAMGFLLVVETVDILGSSLALLWTPLVDIGKGLVKFGGIVYDILTGDFEGAKNKAALMDMQPMFATTEAAFNKLMLKVKNARNAFANTALGTQYYGQDTITWETGSTNPYTETNSEEKKDPKAGRDKKKDEYTQAEKLNDLYKEKSILAKDEVEKAKINLELKQKLYDLGLKEKVTEEEQTKLRLDLLQAQQDLTKAEDEARKKRNDELSKKAGSAFDRGETRRKEYKDIKSSLLKLKQGNEVGAAPDWMKEQVQAEIDYRNALNDVELSNHHNKEQQKAEIEKQYANIRLAIEQKMQEQKLSVISNAFLTVAGFMAKNTLLYKVMAIATATIDTYAAASKALAAYPPPFGAIAMGTAIAQGLANVATISGIEMPGYEKGGFAMVGEKGPEIIAPLQDYASGQAALIAATTAIVERKMQGGNGKMDISVTGRIKGHDLVLAYDRRSKRERSNRW